MRSDCILFWVEKKKQHKTDAAGKGQVSAGLGGRRPFTCAFTVEIPQAGAVGGRFIYSVKEHCGQSGGSSDRGALVK